MNKKIEQNEKGFTLIELILYVAIAAIVVVGAVNIAWNLIFAQVYTEARQEVYYNGRLLLNELTLKIREAQDVSSGSMGSHPSSITLDYPGSGTDVIIDTYDKSVNVGGQPSTIKKIRIKEGPLTYADLTSDTVNVTNFTLDDYTRGSEPAVIKVFLTLEHTNPGGDPKYDASQSYETTVSIR